MSSMFLCCFYSISGTGTGDSFLFSKNILRKIQLRFSRTDICKGNGNPTSLLRYWFLPYLCAVLLSSWKEKPAFLHGWTYNGNLSLSRAYILLYKKCNRLASKCKYNCGISVIAHSLYFLELRIFYSAAYYIYQSIGKHSSSKDHSAEKTSFKHSTAFHF